METTVEDGHDDSGTEGNVGLPGGPASQDTYDHPSTKIWSVYMSEATPHDRALIEGWSKDMDGILIFAGLFSASVTAFIIESYGGLMPDPNERTIALLQQISQQLDGRALQNSTAASDSFSPTASALRVNAFWFLSLCLALTCALAATLVQQWARNYLQAIERRPAPYVQARIRSYLYQGMEKFKMSAVVEGIPTLLHASVFLFFAGLVDFLYSVNRQIAWVTLSIVAACGTLYLLITILPVVHRQSPFQTPLSKLFWIFCRFLGLLRYRSSGKWKRIGGNMWQGKDVVACAVIPARTERDFGALSWTLKSLTEDKELLPFVEGIPAFCTVKDGAYVMRKILMDDTAQLLPRLIALLRTCDKSGSLTAAARRTRSISCLNAIGQLCKIYSDGSWDFICAYEPALRGAIMPMTQEPDQQVANAAINAASTVVVYVKNCILLHARQDTYDIQKYQAARLKGVLRVYGATDRDEFGWGLQMLRGWDSLVSLAEMLPALKNSAQNSVENPFGLEEGLVTFCPAFKNALLQFFFELDFHSLLRPCVGVDLTTNRPCRRRACAFMEALLYVAPHRVLTNWTNRTDVRKMFTALSAEAKILAYFLEHRGCQVVTQYAACAVIQMATLFQRHLVRYANKITYLKAARFDREIPNRDMHSIRSVHRKPGDTAILKKMEERSISLYSKLPQVEQSKLPSFAGIDRSKALALCRGHIRLLVALLEHFCYPSEYDDSALRLAHRTVTEMTPYLNARFSCRRDQMQLVELCKTIFDGLSGMQTAPVSQFILLLLDVLGTIGDPNCTDSAKNAMKGCLNSLGGRGDLDAANAALTKLENMTPLAPLEDEDDERDEVVIIPAQQTANMPTLGLGGASDPTLQGSSSENGAEAVVAALAMEEEDGEV